MDEMTNALTSELVPFFRSYGVQGQALLQRLCETVASQLSPGEPPLDGARRSVAQWMHQVVGVDRSHVTGHAAPGWERLAFLTSGMAAQAPELLLSAAVPESWRERLSAAVPRPTPSVVAGQMPEQSLEAIPALVALRSFVLPAGPKAEEGQEPTL